MTASDAESWAKLRLVEGESSASKWELVSSLGHTTLTVGSNSDCTWVVRGEGVRPIHFSLHWDGSRLRVADVYSAGDVRVDGVELGSQWRPLGSRVRIEFGRAAMVVETSASSASHSSEHPLESASSSPMPSAPSITVSAASSAPPSASSAPPAAATPSGAPDARRKAAGPRNSGKETLIGVAPQTLLAARQFENYEAPSVTSELPPGVSAKDARRAERERAERERAERERAERAERGSPSMKATLVGGIGLAGLGLTPTPIASRAGSKPASSAPTPGVTSPSSAKSAGPHANATLMGFNMAEALREAGPQPSVIVGRPSQARGEPVSGGSLADPDQRTVQGFPQDGKAPSSAPPVNITIGPAGRRMTQKGMVSQQPGVDHAAVAQVQARSVSSPPRHPSERTERIASAWQEQSDDPFHPARTLRGVQEPEEDEQSRRPPRLGHANEWGREERFSDIPTQMRDPTTFESRRPSRGFPWRYVGVLVLTGVAYFAWLYLLDHL